jgi:hypothetical protein
MAIYSGGHGGYDLAELTLESSELLLYVFAPVSGCNCCEPMFKIMQDCMVHGWRRLCIK